MFEVNVSDRRSVFPVIDFKLLNSGHATAIIWKYCLVVQSIQIDPSPDLSARISGQRHFAEKELHRGPSEPLRVRIQDGGWGDTVRGVFSLSSRDLNQLVREEDRTFEVEITLGNSIDLKLNIDAIDKRALAKLRERKITTARASLTKSIEKESFRWIADEKWRLKAKAEEDTRRRYREWCKLSETEKRLSPFSNTVADSLDVDVARASFVEAKMSQFNEQWITNGWVPIEIPVVTYRLTDTWSRSHKGELSPKIGNIGGEIYVSDHGFAVVEQFANFCISAPDTRYCAIIDADKGKQVREYRTSRKIMPGDADHFQMTIGATKSCIVTLELVFFINKDEQVKSNPFKLEIWNPRSRSFHLHHTDGEEKAILQPFSK